MGDTIQLDATTIGKVERIGIRASIILLTNGAEVIVPNGNLISNPVTNWTLSNCERLLEIPISVSPKVNLQQALDVLTHAAASHPDVLKNPPPQAVLVSLGATSVALKVRCWVDAEEDWMKITTQLGISTIQALERENIPMA
ncbi:MAG: mechanosensitive ion channel domain-containing protein [Verrucomicrobiota bacterium]